MAIDPAALGRLVPVASPCRRRLRPDVHGLTFRFALYAAAVVVIAGLGLVIFLRHEVTLRTEHTLGVHSRFMAETSLRHVLRPSDFAGPVTAARRAELDGFSRSDLLAEGTVRVKLWSPRGVVTYSNDHSVIGSETDDREEIDKVLAGAQAYEVSPLNSEGGNGPDLKALSVYTPIRLGAKARPVGVFEIYQDYAPVAATVRSTLVPVVIALTLTLLALYVSLFPILRRVTRTLEARNLRLAEQAAELDLALGEQRDAESALRSSKQTIESIVDASPLAIIALGPDTRVHAWNRAAERIFGWTAAEVLGKPNPTMPPEERESHRERIAAAMRGNTIANKEVRRLRKDGTIADVVLSTAPMRDPQGRVTGAIGVLADITERKRAEEQAHKAELQFRTLVEQLPLATYTEELDQESASYMSPQIEQIVGYTAEEWVSDPNFFSKCLHPEDRDHVLATFAEMHRTGEPQECEYRLIARDGRVVWCHDAAVGVRDESGRPLYIQGCLVDVSERRAAAEALRESEEQLRQAQKLEAVGRLAGGVAHDFNNMMSAVVGFSELALSELEQSHPLRGHITEIHRAGERATTMTNQLLAFSRKQILQPQTLNLNAVVSETETLLERLIGDDIELVSVLEPNLDPIEVDPVQLQQVLVNLALNARDAMPRGGRLTVETANVTLDSAYAASHLEIVPGDYVQLAVSDTGIGMDADVQRRIFEPFFTTKEPGKGTGLGLSTVFGVVKQHGGAISVESEPECGSTFRIYLRRTESLKPAPQRPAPELTHCPAGSATILVVEDEELVLNLERAVLEQCGYIVLAAVTPADALQLSAAFDGPIDLLLTDVVMPGMSGRELAERLVVSRPAMKVLYSSGYTGEEIVRHGVLAEGIEFLPKPVTPTSLTSKVREVLDP
jgi:two-component system cell cycle sensor histidine kinase/response regulator CckA